MYEQTAARRRFGMRGREIVQKRFNGARYLREHEQMLWIGKAMKDMRRVEATESSKLTREPSRHNAPENYQYSEIMGYRRSIATGSTVSFSGMSPAQTLVPPSSAPSSKLKSSLSVDTRLALSGSKNATMY